MNSSPTPPGEKILWIVISEMGIPSRNRSFAFFEDEKVCSRVMFPSLSMMHPASFSLWMSNPA
jgi:hypothetical protein